MKRKGVNITLFVEGKFWFLIGPECVYLRDKKLKQGNHE